VVYVEESVGLGWVGLFCRKLFVGIGEEGDAGLDDVGESRAHVNTGPLASNLT